MNNIIIVDMDIDYDTHVLEEELFELRQRAKIARVAKKIAEKDNPQNDVLDLRRIIEAGHVNNGKNALENKNRIK